MPANLPDDNMTLPADDIFVRIIGATLYLILLVLSACVLFMAITTPSDVSFGWNTAAFMELAQMLIGFPFGVLGVGISRLRHPANYPHQAILAASLSKENETMTMTYAKQDLRLGNNADLNEIARIATEHVEGINYRYDSSGHEPLLRYVDALIGRRQQARRDGSVHVIVWLEEGVDDPSLDDYDLIEQVRGFISSTISGRYHCTVEVDVNLSSSRA